MIKFLNWLKPKPSEPEDYVSGSVRLYFRVDLPKRLNQVEFEKQSLRLSSRFFGSSLQGFRIYTNKNHTLILVELMAMRRSAVDVYVNSFFAIFHDLDFEVDIVETDKSI